MTEQKNDKRKLILKIIYYSELVLLICLIVGHITSLMFFFDFQRLKVLFYVETNMLEEMTVEDCKEIFGEPIHIYNDGMLEFDGGSICSGGFLLRYYEYILYVKPDEDGIGIKSAYDWCVYERIY